jgi:hypothetical protein
MKNDKRKNNNLQSNTQTTKDRETRPSLQSEGNSGSVSSSVTCGMNKEEFEDTTEYIEECLIQLFKFENQGGY